MRKAALLSTLLALLLSCVHIPKVGDSCNVGDAFCQTYDIALACQGGQLLPFPCPGPRGCMVGADRIIGCDQSKGALATTPCLPEYEGRGQCSKKNPGAFLRCLKGEWLELPCPKDQTCQLDGQDMVCK